ncbi:MAG: CopD family protein [Candidatus Latescibacterota bacterium]
MPEWTVAVLRAVHIGAAVVWLGGMYMNMRVVMPVARQHLAPADLLRVHGGVHRRFALVVYASIALLLATGAVMTWISGTTTASAAPAPLWWPVMVAKHGLFLAMGGIAVYILARLAPTLSRLATAPEAEEQQARLARLRRRQHRLVQLNLCLAVVMLLASSAAHVLRHP